MTPQDWTVLVVEDDHDSIQMVSKILTHYGAHVHIAHNGRECLESVDGVNPTLIVMDLAMPEMDGWETLVELRANPSTAHIPVVAITAYHSGNVEEEAARVGFDAYFPKPLSPTSFVEDLAHVVN